MGAIGIGGVVSFSNRSEAVCRAEKGARIGESIPESEYTAWGSIGAVILGLLVCGAATTLCAKGIATRGASNASG